MKKTEFTKTAIINSTVKLLKANGKVTIKEISDDAGVNIAAINYHFRLQKNCRQPCRKFGGTEHSSRGNHFRIFQRLPRILRRKHQRHKLYARPRKRGIQQLFQQNGKPDVFNGFRFVL